MIWLTSWMSTDIPAVILAGGRSRRMGGGDKPLLALDDQTMLEHVVAALAPQVSALALNANGDPARFARFRLPIVADSVAGLPGPLAGVLAGMEWTIACFPNSPRVLTVGGDMPFLPADLVSRLAGASRSGIVCAASAGRLHPIVSLWPVALAPALRRALDEGVRRVADFAAGHACTIVEFPVREVDPFFNVNRPDDLASARRHLDRA